MSRELLQQALMALEYLSKQANDGTKFFLIEDIKKELAKPEPGPVAWLEKSKNFRDSWFLAYSYNPDAITKPLYEHPYNAEIDPFNNQDPRISHGSALLMIANLNRQIDDIKCAVKDCFGNQVIACDSSLTISVDNYNNLVDKINLATSRLEINNDPDKKTT